MAGGLTSYGLPTLPETNSERDIRLLKTWKKAVGFKKDQALTELMEAMQGPIMTAVNAYAAAPLPRVTLELMAKQYAVDAFNDFDTSRGYGFSSYVITSVKQKLYRYVGQYQNVARIPEHQIGQIGPLNEATADLTSRFGREPTSAEVADHMGIPIENVTDMRRLMRKDLTEEGGGGVDQYEAYEHDPDFERASMSYYGMSTVERQIFDFSLGAHGQPKLSTNEIASRLRISAGRVSQLKKSVALKIKPFLTGAA